MVETSPKLSAVELMEPDVRGGKIVLSWLPVKSSYPGDEIRYEVRILESVSTVQTMSAESFSTSSKLTYNGKETFHELKNPKPNTTYSWEVTAIDKVGVTTKSGVFYITTPNIEASKIFNVPNPFNPNKGSTEIVYTLKASQQVKIKIYSEMGHLEYKVVTHGVAGMNSYIYDGRDGNGRKLFNGTHICRLETQNEGKRTCRIAIVR
jgi:hypothetical protein